MSIAQIIEEKKSDCETWRHTSLGVFEKTSFSKASLSAQEIACVKKELDAALTPRLVFLNGAYCSELSFLDSLPQNLVQQDDQDTYSLSFSSQLCLAATPIELIFVSYAEKEARETSTTLRITLGANARVTLLERHVCLTKTAEPFASLVYKEIFLAPQAKLVHAVMKGHQEQQSNTCFDDVFACFSQTKACVSAGAYYDVFDLTTATLLNREKWIISLEGELAQMRFLNTTLLEKDHQSNLILDVTHHAPNCTSQQICKHVLKDRAHGVFIGRILVAKDAQKTDGQQTSRALLLSDLAVMNATPSLEIYADDIKCSHGCTMGDLDETALFYLQSRGVPEVQARFLLIQAFFADIFDLIQDSFLRTTLEKTLQNRLLSFSEIAENG